MQGFRQAVVRLAPFLLFAASLSGFVAEVTFSLRDVPRGAGVDWWTGRLGFAVVVMTFAGVGVLLARRRPRNPMGWALLVFGLGTVNTVAGSWARSGLPGWELGSWWFAAGWPFGMVALWAAFLVFPDGRPLTSRWRWVTRVAVISFGVLVVVAPLLWPYRGEVLLGDVMDFPRNAMLLALVPIVAIWFTAPAALLSLVLRYRRSTGVERLQLKWLLAAVVPIVVGFVWMSATRTGPQSPNAPVAATTLMIVGFLALPIAIGIAILRYRLYSIDRILHRGAVYSIVTLALAGTYILSVLLLQQALAPLGGGNDLSVAVSTLLVAAAFGPVRRHTQRLVDRRFNRRRYDAAAIIDSFGHRLRDEIEVSSLGNAVCRTAGTTVEPTSVSLWLRARA